MKGNGTGIDGGDHWNPENITAFATGMGGFVVSLLTFAYIKFKQQFSDEQKTEIQLKTIMHEGGRREITVTINLNNDERYTAEYVALLNGKSNPAGALNDAAPDTMDDLLPVSPVMAENMQTVMGNNNLGDKLIGATRNHVVRDVLNTIIKLEQLQLLGQDGNNNAPLNVRSLQSPDRLPFSPAVNKGVFQPHTPSNLGLVPEPDDSILNNLRIVIAGSEDEQKESPIPSLDDNYDTGLIGAGAVREA